MSLATLKKKSESRHNNSSGKNSFTLNNIHKTNGILPLGIKRGTHINGCFFSPCCSCNEVLDSAIKKSHKSNSSMLSMKKYVLTNSVKKLHNDTQNDNIKKIKQQAYLCNKKQLGNNKCNIPSTEKRVPLCNPNYISDCLAAKTNEEYIESLKCN